MVRLPLSVLMALALASAASAQTPQPFPRAGAQTEQARPGPRTETPVPAAPASAPQASPAPPVDPRTPTEATLGVPIYPTAQFLASYDAGKGQRYYVFGTTAPYTDLVTYYKAMLKTRGDEVFAQPPTYMFQVGRFRDETMAFPPGVTVKDWTWNGSPGYANPDPAGQPTRFPTIVMIVPPPPAAPPR